MLFIGEVNKETDERVPVLVMGGSRIAGTNKTNHTVPTQINRIKSAPYNLDLTLSSTRSKMNMWVVEYNWIQILILIFSRFSNFQLLNLKISFFIKIKNNVSNKKKFFNLS